MTWYTFFYKIVSLHCLSSICFSEHLAAITTLFSSTYHAAFPLYSGLHRPLAFIYCLVSTFRRMLVANYLVVLDSPGNASSPRENGTADKVIKKEHSHSPHSSNSSTPKGSAQGGHKDGQAGASGSAAAAAAPMTNGEKSSTPKPATPNSQQQSNGT